MTSLCSNSVGYYILDAILTAHTPLTADQIVDRIQLRCSRFSTQTILSGIAEAARSGYISTCLGGYYCVTLKGVSQPEYASLMPQFVGCPSVVANTANLVFSDELAVQNPFRGFMVTQTASNAFPHTVEFALFSWSTILLSGPPYVYDWTPVDAFISAAAARSHHSVIRIVMDFPGDPAYAPPAFLGAPCTPYTDLGGGCLTDYTWPALVAAAQDTLVQLRTRYDPDNRLVGVQVGFLGFYGDWFAQVSGSNVFPGAVTQQPYLTEFSQWTNVPVTIAIPALGHGLGVQMATNTIGLFDPYFAKTTDAITVPLMTATGTTDTWTTWLRNGELAAPEQTYWFDTPVGLTAYLYDLPIFHPAYIQNDAALSYTGAARDRALQAAASTGYLYWISSVTFEQNRIIVVIQNSGSAPIYFNCTLQCSINGGLFQTIADVRLLLPFVPITTSVPTTVVPVTVSFRLVSTRTLPGQIIYLMNSTVDPVTGILTVTRAYP